MGCAGSTSAHGYSITMSGWLCGLQRMAFARLFAHAPKVAVLDECTNGIAPDVEEDLV